MRTVRGLLVLSVTILAATSKAEELFDNPVKLFQAALVPALTHSERAKVQTTWRGFYLRADRQSAFKNEYDPSENGIYLDVAVRDAEEIRKFTDSTQTNGDITKRVVKYPATGNNVDQGLVITLVYGRLANATAVNAIVDCIVEIKRKTAAGL